MLTEQQKNLGTAVADLAKATIGVIPNAAEVSDEYLSYIADELKRISTAIESTNPVKDETEAVLGVLDAIADVLPDGTKGKSKFKGAVTMIKGIAHMFGL